MQQVVTRRSKKERARIEKQLETDFSRDLKENPEKYLNMIKYKSTFMVLKYSPSHMQYLDDIVQNIYYKLFKYRFRFDPTKETTPWINSIVHNEVMTLLTTDYTRISKHEPIEHEDEEGNINLKTDIISKKAYDQVGSPQEETLIYKELITYLSNKLNELEMKILSCYINPSRKFIRLVKRNNKEEEHNKIYDRYIISYLKITPQKLISAKTKFFIYINQYIKS